MFLPYRVIQLKKTKNPSINPVIKQAYQNGHEKNKKTLKVSFPKQSVKLQNQSKKASSACSRQKRNLKQQSEFSRYCQSKKDLKPHSNETQNLKLGRCINLTEENPEYQTVRNNKKSTYYSIDLNKTKRTINSDKKEYEPRKRPKTGLSFSSAHVSEKNRFYRYQDLDQYTNNFEFNQGINRNLNSIDLKQMKNKDCEGWLGVHSVYHQNNQQYWFNFSKKLSPSTLNAEEQSCKNGSIKFSNRCYKPIKRSIDGNCGSVQSKKLKTYKTNAFQAYIQQIKTRRKMKQASLALDNSSDINQSTTRKFSSGKLRIQYENQDRCNEKNEIKMVDLEQIYWQWKGYFQDKKIKSQLVQQNKKDRLKSQAEKINKQKRKNIKIDDIDGWIPENQNKEAILEESIGSQF